MSKWHISKNMSLHPLREFKAKPEDTALVEKTVEREEEAVFLNHSVK